uniref:Polyprotein n=1 Tax=Bloodroot marafivirus TaxID=2933138 RepID=A0A9Y0XAA3_9VIRU|nr:polyprotein [Bloodroot marafivirus]CAJ0557116.1 polyprotein [Bloodroot marafivirus]
MAFQSILDSLSSTIHRDTISNPILESQIDPFRQSIHAFPYRIPTTAINFFLNNGIAISGFGSRPHPHPIHKTLELNLLQTVWPSQATTPSTVMFMKESKFRKLQNRNAQFTTLLNYQVTARDSARYTSTSLDLPSTSTCFMHDAIMYFEPAQIVDLFLRSPTLEKLFASAIIPPESSFSTNFSFHPNIYRFSVSDGKLHYYLESNQAHSYTQPASAIQWLRTTKIIHPSVTLTISILDSFGPLHNILIQRGEPPVSPDHDQISFHHPDAILLPAPNDIQQNFAHRLVPTSVYHALFTYVRAVRTLRITDPAGFIRTQSNKPEHAWVHSAAWDNLQQFAVLTAPYRPINHYFLFRSPLARCLHFIKTHHFRLLQASSLVASASILSGCFAASRLFISRISTLTLFRFRLIAPPSTLSQRILQPILSTTSAIRKAIPFLPPLEKGPFFSLTLTPRPSTLFRLPLPPTLQKILPTSWVSTPHVPTSFIIASTCLASIPLLLLSYRWLSGPDSPQSIHDEYIRYFHPSPFQFTVARSPIVVSNSVPFLPNLRPPSESTGSTPAINYPPPPVESPPAENHPEPQNAPNEPPQPPITAPHAPENSDAPPANPSHPTQSISAPITPIPFAIPEPQTRADSPPPIENRVFGLNNPDHPPTPPDSPPPAEPLEPRELAPDRLGTFPTSLPPVPEDPVHSSPLENDPSATGPIVLFAQISPLPFLNQSGNFLTRRRSHWTPPLPAYPTNTDCLLRAVSQAISVPTQTLWNDLCHILPDSLLTDPAILSIGLTTDHLTALASIHMFSCTVHAEQGACEYGIENAPNHFHIIHTTNPLHFAFSPGPPSQRITTPISGAASLHKPLLNFRFNDQYLPFSTIHRYQADPRRAKNLVSNMKNGFDGVLAQIDPSHPSKGREAILALDQSCDVAPSDRTVDAIHLSGFAGCGKTRPVAALLKRKDFSNYRIAVPTTELRAEWKTLLNLPGSQTWRVSTWESALLKNASILVIDEIYKLPRGYLDLALIADPTIRLVIILGDPLQGEYHSTSSSSTNHHLSPEPQHLLPLIDMYCLWSHRMPQNVANFFGVRSFNPQPGFSAFTRQINLNAPVLACSANTAKTLQQCGYHAITIASSQGSTYQKPLTILLDRNCNLLSPHHTLVALTRSKTGIFFSGDLSILSAANHNPMLAHFSSKQPISLAHTFPGVFSKLPCVTSPLTSRRTVLRAGSSEGGSHVLIPANLAPIQNLPSFKTLPFNNKSVPAHQKQIQAFIRTANPVNTSICNPDFQGDVLLRSRILLGDGESNLPQISTHFLPPSRLPLHFDVPSAAPSSTPIETPHFTPAPFEPVYPGADFLTMAATFMPATDPTTKEILFRDQSSNQFPFLDHPNLLAPQPLSLLAPVHNSKHDPTLLPASISKRLRFRSSPHPYAITPQDTLLGTLLFQAHCRAYRRNPNITIPFNPAMFIECINLNEYAQLTSKTQKVIMANAFRSDPDWRWTSVRIFSKTQHKVNEGSIFGPWKACQTLALMHDALILILGPVKKYQRLIDNSDRPPHIYIHAGHTPHELSTWCQQFMTSSHHVANDYTSFDQSQHGEAVVFEALKMSRVSIPQNLIDLHCTIKTSIETQFGPLTCMRLTGEPGTYDDNTDYNLAVIHLQYHISSQPILVSGDDSLIDSIPPTQSSWPTIEPLLNLKFKTEISRYGLFCGYFVGPEGACRSPLALFAKLAIAFDDGSHYEKLPSYITEFSVGHALGDLMWNLFPADQVLYQSANFDYFCRFASRSQKVLLRLGEPDPFSFDSIAQHLKHASYALFSLMTSSARAAYIKLKSRIHFPSNPEIDRIQRELLSFSIPTACLTESQASSPTELPRLPTLSQPTQLLPTLRGGLSSKIHIPPSPTLSQPTTLTIPLPPSLPTPTKPTSPTSSFTHPMESALLSLLSSAIPTLLSKSSSSTSGDAALGQGPQQSVLPLPGTHDAVVSAPTAAPAPTTSLRPPPTVRPSRTDLIRHFQWNCYDLTGVETGTTVIEIVTKPIIVNLAAPYQTARLIHLDACLMPTHNAIKYPVTVEVLWAPASASVPQDRIMATYGSTRLVAGSLTNPSDHLTAPCDLVVNNPTVKSSVSFNDNPRLFIKFWENADSKKLGINAPISASIFIRGSLELTAPATCATY